MIWPLEPLVPDKRIGKETKATYIYLQKISESTRIRTEIEQDSADRVDYFWQFYPKNCEYVFCSFLRRWVFLYTVQLFIKYILNNYPSSVLKNKIEQPSSEMYLEICQTSTSSPYYHRTTLPWIIEGPYSSVF